MIVQNFFKKAFLRRAVVVAGDEQRVLVVHGEGETADSVSDTKTQRLAAHPLPSLPVLCL